MRTARFILVVCFALAIANCPPVFAQGPAGSGAGLKTPTGPQLEIPEKVHDFGDLTEGKIYEHEFVVKNIGTAPYEIAKFIKI